MPSSHPTGESKKGAPVPGWNKKPGSKLDTQPDKKPGQPQQVRESIQHRLEDLPFAGEVQFFWHNLQEMRPWWPILLPLLAWVGWRTYRAERQKVRRERARAQQ